MQPNLYPIMEYDSTTPAMIEPSVILKPIQNLPEGCVLCFFKEVIDHICADAEIIGNLGGESGIIPIYKLDVSKQLGLDAPTYITVVHPGVGAPVSGSRLDEMIAHGCQKFIACGGSGVLNAELAVGHLVIPETAIRDEGTSYHYLPPSREVDASPLAVDAIEATLQAHDLPYVRGKTWTTDGVYRETKERILRRRQEGCITVEMEAAAFFAVAQFRAVTLGQILYCGDDVSGDVWDHRDWQRQSSTRERVFWLAAEAVLRL